MGELQFARPPLGPEESSRGTCRVGDTDRRESSLEARLTRPLVDARALPDLLIPQERQEPGERADEPGLPGARGTDEQEVMSAGKRDLKGAPRDVVPGDGSRINVCLDHT